MKMRNVGRARELLREPAVARPADLPVVEVGLGGVHADDRDVVEVQRLPARPDELLEVHVADVAGVVVAGDHDDLRALDALQVLLGRHVVLAEAHLGEVAGAQDDVGPSSLSSTTTRSIRLGTKYGEPACRSEIWAMVSSSGASHRSSLYHHDTPRPLLVEHREAGVPALAAEAQAHGGAAHPEVADSVTSPSHLGRAGLCT